MSARKDALTDSLSRSREITITVTGRKSGRTISIPVWFVWNNSKLYLLPVEGSDTQWYKNVLMPGRSGYAVLPLVFTPQEYLPCNHDGAPCICTRTATSNFA